ncbi:putative agmatinase [Aspergillus novofumigatus IBT 16806]|uniref:Putative agmatinase n=1 Tax=Aspergillus novofumigatus (strain IBT 16806) TaxID=1392255 RepID=A0A2I1CLL4_ASPN1|nr:putative agmatinase [Aspergillus novofumigatus IBT 16806]PKX98503.1 putative agmatinase [Aspergillus novofumigatus IBT 16806]
MKTTLVSLLALAGTALAHAHHDDAEVVPESLREELLKKWDQEFTFSGIASFAHLKPVKCLVEPDERYDIAVIGAPFDTAVSYRPGARFGPRAIRAASARQMAGTSYNTRAGINPYSSWSTVKDCGDIPVTPFDNGLAERQMYEAFLELGSRPAVTPADSKYGAKGISAGKPKLVTLGGDHSIALPALRALYQIYQKPITVLHFDAHLDTWNPIRYSAYWTSEQSHFNHGFMRIHADDIDELGPMGIVDKIVERIGLDPEQPVYLSVDIDPGGWTTREFIRILRGIEKLNIVGADIVEVSPSYDNKGETTALAAAQVAFEIITSIVKAGAGEDLGGWYGRKADDKVSAEEIVKEETKDEL